jgi:hypothetical protein
VTHSEAAAAHTHARGQPPYDGTRPHPSERTWKVSALALPRVGPATSAIATRNATVTGTGSPSTNGAATPE